MHDNSLIYSKPSATPLQSLTNAAWQSSWFQFRGLVPSPNTLSPSNSILTQNHARLSTFHFLIDWG